MDFPYMKFTKNVALALIFSLMVQSFTPLFAGPHSELKIETQKLLKPLYEELETRRKLSHGSFEGFDLEHELQLFDDGSSKNKWDLEKAYSLLSQFHSLLNVSNSKSGSSSTQAEPLTSIQTQLIRCKALQGQLENLSSVTINTETLPSAASESPRLLPLFYLSSAWAIAAANIWTLIYFGAFNCFPPALCADQSTVTIDSPLSHYCGECDFYRFTAAGTICGKGSVSIIEDKNDPDYQQCLEHEKLLLGVSAGFGGFPLLCSTAVACYSLSQRCYIGLKRKVSTFFMNRYQSTSEAQIAEAEYKRSQIELDQKISELSKQTGITYLRELLEEFLLPQPHHLLK
jgi:hypothetical protein